MDKPLSAFPEEENQLVLISNWRFSLIKLVNQLSVAVSYNVSSVPSSAAVVSKVAVWVIKTRNWTEHFVQTQILLSTLKSFPCINNFVNILLLFNHCEGVIPLWNVLSILHRFDCFCPNPTRDCVPAKLVYQRAQENLNSRWLVTFPTSRRTTISGICLIFHAQRSIV